MARHGENIYKRKDGRYEGRYIKGRNLNGKPLFGYVYGYTYSEVKETLTLAKAASLHNAHICIIGKGTLSDFLLHWLKTDMLDRVKHSTYARYYERIHTYIIPALGEMPIKRLTKGHMQGFVDELSGRGLSPATVRNIAGLLCSAMKKAAEIHLLTENPCAELILPQAAVKERRALERNEQITLEHLFSQTANGTEIGLLLALYAGLRIGEICALRWKDIDIFSGILTVRGTLQRVKNLIQPGPKTLLLESAPKSKGSLRKIPLPNDLIVKLRAYKENIPETAYVLSGTPTPIEPHTFRSRFNRLAAMAGLKIPFHSLRHTFVTRCLELNFDIQTISELLGHATANVTMKIYAHSLLEHKRMLTSRVHILSETYEPSNEPSDELGA